MTKIKKAYSVIFILVLILAITKGFDIGIPINSYKNGDISMLLLNFVIVLSIWIISLILTINKKNNLKLKLIIFIVIILISLFIPVGVHSYYAGIIGKYNKDYVGVFDFIKLIITHL